MRPCGSSRWCEHLFLYLVSFFFFKAPTTPNNCFRLHDWTQQNNNTFCEYLFKLMCIWTKKIFVKDILDTENNTKLLRISFSPAHHVFSQAAAAKPLPTPAQVNPVRIETEAQASDSSETPVLYCSRMLWDKYKYDNYLTLKKLHLTQVIQYCWVSCRLVGLRKVKEDSGV